MNNYTLLDILSGNIEINESGKISLHQFSGIQIPMIQRDYAQGRGEESEVRKRFLKAIFEALSTNTELSLDFVYGSILKIDDTALFLPLDGQQRLTTLYLLYWYVGNRELDNEVLMDLREILLKFSYATRSTARDFCEKLATISLDKNTYPSNQISNAGWFYGYFRLDPTVISMLSMLDEIHERYPAAGSIYPSLQKITFYILPLDGFNLTDELYIKMNARGKQLTDFENFKADLVNWLQDPGISHKTQFSRTVSYDQRQMPYYMYLALQLDNSWTNMFWRFVLEEETKDKKGDKNKDNDKIIDPFFLRFWKRYLLNQYIVSSALSNESLEVSEVFVRFYNEDAFRYESFDHYKELLGQNGTTEKIEKVFNQLEQYYSEITASLAPSWSPKESWKLFSTTINQRQRLLFYAVCVYLENNDFSLVSFQQWIRVIWNLIIDPDIRSISAMLSVMKTIAKLGPYSGSIYDFLQSAEFDDILKAERAFIKAQLEEERYKAHLILSDALWEQDLKKAESHPLLMGNVGFLLLDKPHRDSFTHRESMVRLMCGSKGAIKEFAAGNRLFRALISGIPSWDRLLRFNFTDDIDNWQLLLRRDTEIGKALCSYCDHTDIQEALAKVKSDALRPSEIEIPVSQGVLKKIRRIHGSLYRQRKLFAWMQEHKATELKYYDGRLFIRRPRSWYDWVMLDTWRNQMAEALITELGFTGNQRCGESNFFWGFGLELTCAKQGLNISAWFDQVDTLYIGIREGGLLSHGIVPDPIAYMEGWIEHESYSYLKIRSQQAIKDFINTVSETVFDTSNPRSMLSRYSHIMEEADFTDPD